MGEQRKDYKLYASLKCDKDRIDLYRRQSLVLTPDRAKKLESIGFELSNKNPRHLRWDFRFQQLKKFVADFGHTQVPIGWEENVKLSNWVSTQRQEYKNMQNGRTSQLNEHRIELLNELGFAWEVQRGGRRRRLKSYATPSAKLGDLRDIVPGKTLVGGKREEIKATRAMPRGRKAECMVSDQKVPQKTELYRHEKQKQQSLNLSHPPGLRSMQHHLLEHQQLVLQHQQQLQLKQEALLARRANWAQPVIPGHVVDLPALNEGALWGQATAFSPHLLPAFPPTASNLMGPPVVGASALEMMMLANSCSRPIMVDPSMAASLGYSPVLAARPAASAFQPHIHARGKADPPESQPSKRPDKSPNPIQTTREIINLVAASNSIGENPSVSESLPGITEKGLKTAKRSRRNPATFPSRTNEQCLPQKDASQHTKTTDAVMVVPASQGTNFPTIAKEETGFHRETSKASQIAFRERFGVEQERLEHLMGLGSARTSDSFVLHDPRQLKPKQSHLANLKGDHFEDAENDDSV